MTAAGAGWRWDGMRSSTRRFGRTIFGDRRGLALFFGVLCFAGAYWRAGVFITDTETLIVTLDAVADGQLWIDRVSDSHFQAPGAVVSDGYVYGRNYGQVILSVPILWGLAVLERLADLRVALTALWHLALFGLVLQVGTVIDYRRVAAIGGGAVATISFLLNLVLATTFFDASRPLLALQIGTILTTALLAVVMYRLVVRNHGPGVALFAGSATAIVLPIGFWASLPKRHVTVALLLVVILYFFSRSRSAETQVALLGFGQIPAFRAIAYGFVGLLAWVHAAEAVFVLVALVVVDVPTARSNNRRTLVVIALVLFLALIPTFVTNLAISGEPWTAPRLLTPADVHSVSADANDLGTRLDSGASTGIPVLDFATNFALAVGTQAVDGAFATVEPTRFVQTWIRSGPVEYIDGGRPEFAGSNLAVLESAPIFGAFAVVVAAVASRFSHLREVVSSIEPTDALALSMTLAFVLLYASRLPLHVQITARYLLPTFPLMVYLLVRQGSIERLLGARAGLVLWSYAGGVLIGTQLVLAYVVLESLTVSAAAQTHALLGLATASLLAVTLVGAELDARTKGFAAVGLGLAAAAGTAFIVLSGMVYFSFVGEHVLPVSDAISDLIGRP